MTRYPTLQEATAAGLFHPSCRHTINAYQEGVTPEMHGTEDPQGYADAQQLRYLERQTRAARRIQAAALDDAARAEATKRVTACHKAIRDHVDKTGIRRQPYRERLGAL